MLVFLELKYLIHFQVEILYVNQAVVQKVIPCMDPLNRKIPHICVCVHLIHIKHRHLHMISFAENFSRSWKGMAW